MKEKKTILIIAIFVVLLIGILSVIIACNIDRRTSEILQQGDVESDPHRFKEYPVDTVWVNSWRNSFDMPPVIIDEIYMYR
jgi:capsular polysaccharide biosynthesis protein